MVAAAPGDLGSALLRNGCVLWSGRPQPIVLSTRLVASARMHIGLRVYDWQGDTPVTFLRKWLSKSKLQRELIKAVHVHSRSADALIRTYGTRTPWDKNLHYLPEGLLAWAGEVSADFKDPLAKVLPRMQAHWDEEVIDPLIEALTAWLHKQHGLQDTLNLTDRDAWVSEVMGLVTPWLPRAADFPASAPACTLTCARVQVGPAVPGLMPVASPEALDAWALKALPTGREAMKRCLTNIRRRLADKKWYTQTNLPLDEYAPRALRAHVAWDFTSDSDGSIAAVRRLLDYRAGFLPRNPFTGPGAYAARCTAADLTKDALKAIYTPDATARNTEALLSRG